jgi:hypothetical protein
LAVADEDAETKIDRVGPLKRFPLAQADRGADGAVVNQHRVSGIGTASSRLGKGSLEDIQGRVLAGRSSALGHDLAPILLMAGEAN